MVIGESLEGTSAEGEEEGTEVGMLSVAGREGSRRR